MRRKIRFCSYSVLALFFVLTLPEIAGGQKWNSAPVGGNLLPDGFYITPTATPGSIFQRLTTGLRPDGSADANGAVTTALSPDGTALLILTTGYNTNFFNQDSTGTPILWPALDPTTGLTTTTTTPNAEWVFVFDVRGSQPVQKQQINIPDTYHGLLWDPSGKRFYVAGGIDDRIYVYKATSAGPSATTTFVPDAPFVLLGHNLPSNVPIPEYPTGGLFNSTPVNSNPFAEDMFIPFSALAAGLAISLDGSTLYVANYQNDSLSIIDIATRKVSNEIHFFVPGQTTAIGEMPYWLALVSNSKGATVKTYVTSQRDGQVLVVQPSGSFGAITVGGEPNRMVLSADQHHLYVANGDLDEIEVIDTTKDVVESRISVARPGYPYKGSNPNSLTLSPDGRRLYATLGGENAVAVIDLAFGTVIGRIPTGWYPSSVTVSPDGKRLFVVNMKSNAGPNLEYRIDCPGEGIPAEYSTLLCPTVARSVKLPVYPYSSLVLSDSTSRNEYILPLLKSGFLTIPVPDDGTLALLSVQVDANNGFFNRRPDPMMAFLHQQIKHVIYIQKENRTYDQVLGDLKQGNGDPSRVQFPQPISPNHHLLGTQFALLDNYYDAGDVSGDGWNWDTQGHANDATVKNVLVGYGNANFNIPFDWNGNPRNIGIALPDQTSGTPSPSTVRITTLIDPTGGSSIEPGTKDITASEGADDLSPDALGGYIWDTVLRAGKTVRHYGLYADENYYVVPSAPTSPPSRQLYIPIVRNAFAEKVVQAVPVRPSLMGRTDLYYRGWDLNTPDQYRFEEWNREFNEYVKNGNLPDFEMVDFMEDHFGNFSSNAANLENPLAQMASNDYAVGRLVEAVSHSPYWKDTAIFVVEDDAQDGPDHVDAHRSTAFVVSPYTQSGAVVHTNYNSTNVVRTIEDILGVNYLGLNDANARPMSDVFMWQPNLTPYIAPIPGILCLPPVDPTLVPECKDPAGRPITAAVKPLHDGAWWNQATKGLNFNHPDMVNADLFNRILWRGIMGDKKPYPAPPVQQATEADRD